MPRPQLRQPPIGDLWCVRDSVCQLLGWPPGSDEWSRFIEAPHQDDMLPLYRHLGLLVCDVSIEQHVRELAGLFDHPGIASFIFPSIEKGHAVYLGHLRTLGMHHATGYRHLLHPLHLAADPELFWVIVDPRQPPHVPDSALPRYPGERAST